MRIGQLSRSMYAWGGPSRWFNALASIVLSIIALWVTDYLWRGEEASLLIFALAILVSALFLGPAAAIITAALSAAFAIAFVLEPRHSLAITSETDLRVMLAFFAVAAVSVVLARALHRTQARLRRLLEEREDTLAIVSHDLRNPLTRIQLDAELAKQSLTDSGSLMKKINRIQETAQEMNRFVSDLLLIAQAEEGSLALQKSEFSVTECLKTALDRISPLAELRHTKLTLKSVGQCNWYGDYDRLLQMVINLLGNAIKYGKDNGHVELHCEGSERHVILAVRDDGPGIPLADQAHLFERFWRGGRNRKDTGLGLYICKKIAEAHGGRIWAESDGKSGTAFWVKLPRCEPHQDSTA